MDELLQQPLALRKPHGCGRESDDEIRPLHFLIYYKTESSLSLRVKNMSDINKVNSNFIRLNTAAAESKDSAQLAGETEKKYREVSQLYEKYFIGEMMKGMRSTVQESGFIKQNNAEKIFRDQLDDQYSEQWGKAGGIGLSNLIYDQLVQRYGTGGVQDSQKIIDKPQGPIALDAHANISLARVSSGLNEKNDWGTKTHNDSAMTFQLRSPPGQRTELQNPWAGTLLDKKYLQTDQLQYRIKHDNGLESLILTQGTGLGADQQLSQGDTIRSGQQLGWISPASPLVWTVRKNVSE